MFDETVLKMNKNSGQYIYISYISQTCLPQQMACDDSKRFHDGVETGMSAVAAAMTNAAAASPP
jgi:hypothetical protein